jgi:tetratricopeptide (TPR) repeat protein
VVSVAFSPDGHRLVSGGIDWHARVWDATPLPADVLRRHELRYQEKRGILASPTGAGSEARWAETLEQVGQHDRAVSAWARAIEQAPNDLGHRHRYAQALHTVGDTEGLRRVADASGERFGTTTDTADQLNLAAIYALAGEWDRAASALGKAVEGQPDDRPRPHMYSLHHLALLEAGQPAQARRAVSEMLARFGEEKDPRLARNVAWSAVLSPGADPELPIRLAQVALDAYSEYYKPTALNTLGAALYRAGRFDEAIRRLEESVKAVNGQGWWADWAFLAMAHHRLGHRQEARFWLDKLRAFPWSPTDYPDRTAYIWSDLGIRVLLREAEALIVYDPIFPADPFAR